MNEVIIDLFIEMCSKIMYLSHFCLFQVYELLCILDFNNVRKRMSVILRKDGEIRLYTKGADNVIYDRLKSGNQTEVRSKTQEHLNVS